jgi:hypothetical protein
MQLGSSRSQEGYLHIIGRFSDKLDIIVITVTNCRNLPECQDRLTQTMHRGASVDSGPLHLAGPSVIFITVQEFDV